MAKGGIGSLYDKVGKEFHSKKKLDNVPVRWRSSPDHPETQLAYITDEEASLLKQLDLHGSGVRYNKHIGPQGIPSYNGAGSGDSGSSGDSGTGGDSSTGGSPAGDASGGFGGGVGDSGNTGGSPAGDASGGFGGGVGDSGNTGGSPAGDASGGFGGGVGNSGNTGGGVVGGGDVGPTNSVSDALGQTAAGAFGPGGVVGVSTGVDVSTGLSAIGLGDVTMGTGFGPGGIMGTGTTMDGVSGLGAGGGSMTTGGAFSNSIGDVLGNTGPVGFAATETGFSTSPSSTPFGGATLGGVPGAVAAGPASFGAIGTSGLMTGAPYGNPDAPGSAMVGTGMLGAGGIPGSRADALANQRAAMETQVQQNPTYSVPANTTNQQIATAFATNTIASLATPTATQTVSQALSAPATAVSAPAVAPAVEAVAPSVTVAAPTAATPTATQTAAVSPATTAPTTSAQPTSSQPTSAPTASTPGRSASSVTTETFSDPLTGAPVSVTTYSDGTVEVTSPSQEPGWGQTALSTAVNLGTSLLGPVGLGLQGLSYVGTGQSVGTNVGNLAFGGGLSPTGGLLGSGPSAGYNSGPSNPNASQGEGGGGGVAPSITPSTPQQPNYNLAPAIDAVAQVPRQLPKGWGGIYDLAQFGIFDFDKKRETPTYRRYT